MSTLEYSSLDMLWRVADLTFWNKDWLREQERLYGKKILTVTHTGLDGLNGLVLGVWRGQLNWEIP